MKRFILGTTALFALMTYHQSASGQEPTPKPANSADQPIKLELGGLYVTGYGLMLQQSDNPGQSGYKHRADGLMEDVKIAFQGSTKLSNGLDVGVFVRLRGENYGGGSTVSDEVHTNYVFFKHAQLGEFRVGDINDLNVVMGYQAPQVDPNLGFGTNTPSISFSNGPVATQTTTQQMTSKSTKFMYFTPAFSGFQLGFSYAPDGLKGNSTSATNAGTDYYNTAAGGANSQKYRDQIGVGASWKGEVGSLKLGFEGHYVQAQAKEGFINPSGGNDLYAQNADPMLMGAGVKMGYGPWSIGGAYERGRSIAPSFLNGTYNLPGIGAVKATSGNLLNGTLNHETNDVFDVGVAYTVGPWRYGVAWSRAAYKGLVDGGDRTPKNNIVSTGAGYQIGPGIQLIGLVQFNDYDADGAALAQPKTGDTVTLAQGGKGSYFYSKGFDSTALILGTDIRF